MRGSSVPPVAVRSSGVVPGNGHAASSAWRATITPSAAPAGDAHAAPAVLLAAPFLPARPPIVRPYLASVIPYPVTTARETMRTLEPESDDAITVPSRIAPTRSQGLSAKRAQRRPGQRPLLDQKPEVDGAEAAGLTSARFRALSPP